MKRVSKNVNCVKTEILTWGEPFVDKKQDIIVCISGNPGIADFYIDFASELYKDLQLPICVIGHAGHDDNFNDKSNELDGNEHLFGLHGQTKHKLDFLENHVHTDSKIHLIGHSIGAWLIVESLHKNDILKDRVLSINLLFPTLQRMADTKNGKFVNNFYRNFHRYILLLVNFLYFFPKFVIISLINLCLAIRSLPNCYSDSIYKIINPYILEKILLLAYDEMDTVTKLNKEGINKVKHLTHVIYSIKDGWVPLEYMDNFKKYEPFIKLTKADDIEHAFILKSSEQVADMVAKFIKSKAKD